MCGRYTFFDEEDLNEIEGILRKIQEGQEAAYKSREVFPTNVMPVITQAASDWQLEKMKWGFPKWDGKGVIINARSETAAEKKTFAKPLAQYRCVVPTVGFYEWDKTKTKKLFTYDESPVMYLAGIYNMFKKDGQDYKAYTIMTRAANQSIEDVHNRMPVILYPNEIMDYLSDLSNANFIMNRDSVELNRTVA